MLGSCSSKRLTCAVTVYRPLVPQARSGPGQLQPPDDQVRARLGHEPPRLRRQRVPRSSQDDRRHRFRLQIVSTCVHLSTSSLFKLRHTSELTSSTVLLRYHKHCSEKKMSFRPVFYDREISLYKLLVD